MLKHFQVPDDIAARVDVDALRSTTEAVFKKCGVPQAEAELGADVLMFADLKGIDTHGVSNMLRHYVQMYGAGVTNPVPDWRVVRETPTTALIDGDGGLGLMIAPKAMRIAIDKARQYGSGVVTIRNAGHLGAAGYHAAMAAEEDMIGWCMTAGGRAMVPTYGAEPRIGTNPIAVAAPARREPMFLFDAAMTSIAGNKVGLAVRLDQPMQAGWVAHDDGTPDMEGGQRIREFAAQTQRMQLPVGGTREMGSHKGYGLGTVVEILCGQLSFAPGFADLTTARRGHFVAAYSIDAFGPADEFKDSMDSMLRMLRETKPMPGQDRVAYAGLLESEEEIDRLERGVPLHPEVIDWFKGICAEFDIPFELAPPAGQDTS